MTATVPLASEGIEPTMARIVGVMFARCEQAKDDPHKLFNACCNFWWAVKSINRLAIAITEGESCVHFSIAASNNLRTTANYIASLLGDPQITFTDDKVITLESLYDEKFGWH